MPVFSETIQGGEFTKDFVEFAIDNMVNSQKKYCDPDLLFVRSVDWFSPKKCSLKCKDCANLMQYYENPVNIDKQELIEDLEDLMVVADEVNEIRIIGGEPMMNKDFHEVSLQAASYDKVNKVVIYTNGTICPPDAKETEQLKNDKILFSSPPTASCPRMPKSCAHRKPSSSVSSTTTSLPMAGRNMAASRSGTGR